MPCTIAILYPEQLLCPVITIRFWKVDYEILRIKIAGKIRMIRIVRNQNICEWCSGISDICGFLEFRKNFPNPAVDN